MKAEESNKKLKAKKKAGLSIKANQQNAFEDLRDHLRLLIALQKNACERMSLSADPISIQLERLDVFDRVMPSVITCVRELEYTLKQKQPGGHPGNKFRPMAFDLLTDHYSKHRYVLTAQELVDALSEKLPKGTLDPDESGNQPFSPRVAREAIKKFKACLNAPPADWN
jgi:hypothetical protein